MHIERTVEEVADGVFAYVQPDGSWFLNNCGFVVAPGRRGTLAIDASSTEARTRRLIETIDHYARHPATLLANTHHHGDHTHGNYLFDQATIVAHRLCREEMLQLPPPAAMTYWNDVEWGEIRIEPPTLTFDTTISIHVGELECVIEHVGTPAHTTNDSVVWIPERSVLFCGDLLFNGGTPFVLMGSVDGALEVLDKVRSYGAETIVAGHGPVTDSSVIGRVESYLRFVQQVARSGWESGLSPLEAALETDLGEFADLLDSERIVGNLHRAYAELDGRPRGAKIDDHAALTDMVRFNGGKPLLCHA